MLLALIDGDILLHEVSNKIRTEVLDNGGEIIYAEADFGRGLSLISEYIDSVLKETDTDVFNIILSDLDREANFRRRVYPPYKSNRSTRPLGFSKLRHHLEENFPSQWIPTLEADDIQGIMATNPNGVKNLDCVVVSLDKDMMTIPGSHFNPTKPELGVHTVSPVEADYNFFTQVLVGDRTDGYPGCPGIGEVGAKRLLGGIVTDDLPAFRAECWSKIVTAYEKAKLTEEDALAQARCARILRAEDFDFDLKAPKLWKPEAL